MTKRYYSLYTEGREASINIYGDITSWPWLESDVSSYNLSKEIDSLDVDTIHVYINSYGGEVFEGLAIYNQLKRHKANVITYADGIAASIASIIFAAGDERVIYDTSMLMIHNVWQSASGNAEQLRKVADELEVVNSTTMNALKAVVNISEEELKAMLDGETWINAQEALDKGFATRIDKIEKSDKVSASARGTFFAHFFNKEPSNLQTDVMDTPKFRQWQSEVQESVKKAWEMIDTLMAQIPAPAADPPKEQNLSNFLNALTGRKD